MAACYSFVAVRVVHVVVVVCIFVMLYGCCHCCKVITATNTRLPVYLCTVSSPRAAESVEDVAQINLPIVVKLLRCCRRCHCRRCHCRRCCSRRCPCLVSPLNCCWMMLLPCHLDQRALSWTRSRSNWRFGMSRCTRRTRDSLKFWPSCSTAHALLTAYSR